METPKSTKWNALFRDNARYRDLNEVYVLDLLAAFEKSSGMRPSAVVDLGCGNGETLAKFAGIGLATFGVDLSDVALAQAKERMAASGHKATLVLHDLDDVDSLRLDTPEGTLWICKLVIAFVADKPYFLQAVRRLMKNGDRLLLMTPVLRDGVSYTKEDKPEIAVKAVEIEKLLSDVFGGFTVFSNEYPGERGRVVSYLVGF